MTETLVEDYLKRLETASATLPAGRRAELLEEITAHIDEARSSGEITDDATLRGLLDRLGEPEEIAAAARDDDVAGGASTPTPAPRTGTGRETAAVLMLTIGSVVPVLGWLIGVVLLWTSQLWRTGEKVLGTLVVPGGPMLALLVSHLLSGWGPDSALGWFGPVLLVVVLVAPFVVGGVLLYRATVRARAETAARS